VSAHNDDHDGGGGDGGDGGNGDCSKDHRIIDVLPTCHDRTPDLIPLTTRYNGRRVRYVLVQSRRMSLRGETGPATESHPQ